ncbi:curli assembly protein CsgC [Escherichia coli EC096/10]|nr:curli assembly protein CsgC [Escherichia coli EC096/10]
MAVTVLLLTRLHLTPALTSLRLALVTTRPLISTNTSSVLKKQGASPVFFREKNMNALLLLAALSSQITFNTTQQGDMYTIIPEVTLTQSCLCRVQILSLREGSSGKSQTKQEKTLSLPANQPIALTKLSLNISPDDRVKIVVTVSDGQSLHLSQQWPPSSEKS